MEKMDVEISFLQTNAVFRSLWKVYEWTDGWREDGWGHILAWNLLEYLSGYGYHK